jgi:hypothetical protein
MVSFIRTEAADGGIYFINIERVTKLHPMLNGGTAITFDGEHNMLTVVTNIADILNPVPSRTTGD